MLAKRGEAIVHRDSHSTVIILVQQATRTRAAVEAEQGETR